MLASVIMVSLFVLILGMDIVVGEWSLCCFSLALTNLLRGSGWMYSKTLEVFSKSAKTLICGIPVLSHYVESFTCFVAVLHFEYWAIVRRVDGFGGSISFCWGYGM